MWRGVGSANVESIADGLSALLPDKERSRKLGQMAKEKVLNTYSIPIVWKQLSEIWSKKYNYGNVDSYCVLFLAVFEMPHYIS